MTNCRDFMETKCIRLKRGVCRLDMKPCRESCPLHKTREEMEQQRKSNEARYYSLLEQHTSGAWWYHKLTFTSKKEAEERLKTWIWWDENRHKTIVEHTAPLPRETMMTFDLKTFLNPYSWEKVAEI